jgi:hypothetical protein
MPWSASDWRLPYYEARVAPDMILAFLECSDDWGWTSIVDPIELTTIDRIEDLRPYKALLLNLSGRLYKAQLAALS